MHSRNGRCVERPLISPLPAIKYTNILEVVYWSNVECTQRYFLHLAVAQQRDCVGKLKHSIVSVG